MKALLSIVISVTLGLGGHAAIAHADGIDESPATAVAETPGLASASVAIPRPVDQTLYKGVVGNLLETLPIDSETRVDLQRTNAVISNPLSARSLGLLLGIANPVFLIGGLIWGIWAATHIEPPKTAEKADPVPQAILATVVQVAHE